MATFGVTNLFGLTAPSIGFVTEATRDRSLEVSVLTDEFGVVRCAAPKRTITVDVTNKGKGDIPLAALTAATIEAGETQVTSQKRTETKNEYPDFEITARTYENLGSTSSSGGTTAPTAPSSGPVCPYQGIVSIGIANTESFEIEVTVEQTNPLLDTDSSFVQADFYNPTYSFTVKGVGDFPPVLAIGSDGDLPSTVTEFSGGVTIVTSTKETQTNSDYPQWEAAGMNYPNAA